MNPNPDLVYNLNPHGAEALHRVAPFVSVKAVKRVLERRVESTRIAEVSHVPHTLLAQIARAIFAEKLRDLSAPPSGTECCWAVDGALFQLTLVENASLWLTRVSGVASPEAETRRTQEDATYYMGQLNGNKIADLIAHHTSLRPGRAPWSAVSAIDLCVGHPHGYAARVFTAGKNDTPGSIHTLFRDVAAVLGWQTTKNPLKFTATSPPARYTFREDEPRQWWLESETSRRRHSQSQRNIPHYANHSGSSKPHRAARGSSEAHDTPE